MKVEKDYRQLNIKQIQTNRTGNNKGFQQKQLNYNNNKYNPNFTGAFDLFLRFLDTNQAWGANFVDLAFMVTPRTVTDFGRGGDAGVETLRREGTGTANHSSIGLYGSLAGMALASGINSAYKLGKNDIKASSIFADSETLDMQGKIWTDILKENKQNPLKELLIRTLNQYEVKSENGNWIKFAENDIEKVANIVEEQINNNSKSMDTKVAYNIKSILMSSVNGHENNFRIIANAGEKEHSSRYTLEYIVENIYKLPKIFNKETVKETFANTVDVTQNAFLKAMKSMNLKRSLIGIGIGSLIGVSTQPINMYLTKLKTGNSGFVGGGEEDKTFGFKLRKLLVAGLFGAGVLASIGNPKNLIKDLQFKGFSPTIKQFKFVYGITIMSRFLVARNDNELKEASIKDVLGFANWLILGNFVQKIVAQSLDKSLVKTDGKGLLKWIQNSSLKSRDEILHASLGKNVFKDGKALKYSEIVKLADKATKKKLRILSAAQIVGYVYSGLVLGLGIPKLNIYLTKRRMEKQANNNKLEQNTNLNNITNNQNQKFLREQQKAFSEFIK